MQFNWEKLTEKDFEEIRKAITDPEALLEYSGAVHVGDICVDVVRRPDVTKLFFDFYVLNEDTGYAYTRIECVPYDYADGCSLEYEEIQNLSYEEFRKRTENIIEEYVKTYKSPKYSLLEHAKRKTVMW